MRGAAVDPAPPLRGSVRPPIRRAASRFRRAHGSLVLCIYVAMGICIYIADQRILRVRTVFGGRRSAGVQFKPPKPVRVWPDLPRDTGIKSQIVRVTLPV